MASKAYGKTYGLNRKRERQMAKPNKPGKTSKPKSKDGTKILGSGIAKMGAKGRKKALTRTEREMKKRGL